MNTEQTQTPIKVVVTGWGGLLGFHLRAAIEAENGSRAFKGIAAKYDVMLSSRLTVENTNTLARELNNADLVIHLAGVNRAEPDVVEHANQDMANILIEAIAATDSKPHLVYSNSSHSSRDTPYGRGKAGADHTFKRWSVDTGSRYSNMVLPHIYGEKAKPFYNNVTATLCHQVVAGEIPTIHDGASVELLHAGAVANAILEAFDKGQSGTQALSGKQCMVQELYEWILSFHHKQTINVFPDFPDRFALTLFNTYRWFTFPERFPGLLNLHEDDRGVLFEAVKGGGGGQTFLSWTKPGIERGHHFHKEKVERFLVVSGTARICVRQLFDDTVYTFDVTGDEPVYVDMPTLHTHSIENTGREPLLTLFWAHEVFDPENPDTFAHNVQ